MRSNALTTPAPLLDLVEIAMVRDPRRRRRNRATVAGRAQQRDDYDAGDHQARQQGERGGQLKRRLNRAFPSCLTEKFKRGLNIGLRATVGPAGTSDSGRATI
jgi:hypothetical protein